MTSSVVDEAIQRWDELLAREPDLDHRVADLRRWLLDHDLGANGRPLCTVLRPHLIEEGDLRRQSVVAGAVIAAIRKVREALIATPDEYGEHLAGFREWIGDLLELEGRVAGDGALMRLDASLARTQLHFIELNADMPQGTGHNDRILEFLAGLKAFEGFSAEYRVRPLRMEGRVLDTLIAAWREWGGDGQPTIATVSWSEDEVRMSSLRIDQEHFQRRGIEAVLCDPRELSFDGERLRHRDLAVDVVHRVLLTGECVRRRDEIGPLMDAIRSGAVCMVNPFRSELLGHKAIFAMLTDPAFDFGFTTGEGQAVRRHVPWTRLALDGRTTDPDGDQIDLVTYAVANREHLVLKPTHDFGGHGVRLGWHEGEAEWNESLSRALETDYILQQRVALHRSEYPTIDDPGTREPYYEDTDPFLFNGRLGGLLTRLSPTEITNVHEGGSVVASLAIEPRR